MRVLSMFDRGNCLRHFEQLKKPAGQARWITAVAPSGVPLAASEMQALAGTASELAASDGALLGAPDAAFSPSKLAALEGAMAATARQSRKQNAGSRNRYDTRDTVDLNF